MSLSVKCDIKCVMRAICDVRIRACGNGHINVWCAYARVRGYKTNKPDQSRSGLFEPKTVWKVLSLYAPPRIGLRRRHIEPGFTQNQVLIGPNKPLGLFGPLSKACRPSRLNYPYSTRLHPKVKGKFQKFLQKPIPKIRRIPPELTSIFIFIHNSFPAHLFGLNQFWTRKFIFEAFSFVGSVTALKIIFPKWLLL